MSERPIRNNLVIELHVPDFDKAMSFYSKLGFEKALEEPTGDQLGYLTLIRKDPLGDSMVNFYGGNNRVNNLAFFKDFPIGNRRGQGVEITIPISNVEEFYQQVLPHIQESVVQELTLKRWGKKDFRVVDPFGFYIRFTELVDWGQE